MSIKKAPRVTFSLEIVPKWRSRVELARSMRRQLSKRFRHICSSHSIDFFRLSGLAVNLNDEYVLVGIGTYRESRNSMSMWEIAVNPARFPVPSKNFPEHEQKKYAKDLLLVSEEIHAVLIRTPGVAHLRWYFEGWDVRIPGVRTPAELPWRVNDAELDDTENSTTS